MTLDRRRMLQGAMALSAAFVTDAKAQPQANPPVPKLQSVANVKVTREEISEIPNGKEHFYEWTLTDDAGTSETTRAHHLRVDTPATYTMSTQIATTRTSSKGNQTSTTHNISVSGIKGEVSDGLRHDHVTITEIGPDGQISRMSREVAVRLDLPEIEGLSTAEVLQHFGNKFLHGGAQ